MEWRSFFILCAYASFLSQVFTILSSVYVFGSDYALYVLAFHLAPLIFTITSLVKLKVGSRSAVDKWKLDAFFCVGNILIIIFWDIPISYATINVITEYCKNHYCRHFFA